MINLEAEYLEKIKKILAKHLDKSAEVFVFGSRITNNFKKYSDLDLAINNGGTKIESSVIGNLKTDFENSLIPVKVDVVDLSDISEEFKNIILKKFERLEF